MKAMILAAGFGKRLGELTKSKPKPLLEVKGKPLIDYHIEKLISSGFKTIAINTHYLGTQISDHIIDNFAQRVEIHISCLLYTSPSPRDRLLSRMPSSA